MDCHVVDTHPFAQLMDDELLGILTQLHTKLETQLPMLRAEARERKEDHPEVPPVWHANIAKVLFSADRIQHRVAELAAKISEDYKGKQILAVGLLKGSFIFASDLLRRLLVPYTIEFIAVSSYEGTESSGNVKVKMDLNSDPIGKHVLVLEDLIDTGITLKWIKEHIASKSPASVRIACLLDKKERRKAEGKRFVSR